LLHAIELDRRANIELLLASNADVNHVDFYKSAPLNMAAESNRYDITLSLLKHGADPTVPDRVGRTLIQWVKERDDSFIVEIDQRQWLREVRNRLSDEGYDVTYEHNPAQIE
jgi:ankyrin repeat protein